MSTSPEHMSGHLPDFRAPPPSPMASGRRSTVVNDDAISEFLEHSLRIPELILPDRIFPIEIPVQNPPEIDFQSLSLLENDSVNRFMEYVGTIGCFLLVNHGISRDLIGSVSVAAVQLFGLSPESKGKVLRSAETMFGFEEELFGAEEEMETSEEFVWCRDDQGFNKSMEGIWSDGYSSFSEKMEHLSKEIEKIFEKVLKVFLEQSHINPSKLNDTRVDEQEIKNLICCLYKHRWYTPINKWDCPFKSDIIRMLIRGSDFSHALSLHLCDGTSEFHLYSKKGWISFKPNKSSMVVTIGDQIQTWSGGQYKNVMGRPVNTVMEKEPISIAFLYSPTIIDSPRFMTESLIGDAAKDVVNRESYRVNKEKNISVVQQIILALLLILIYQLLVLIYKKF